MKQAVSGILAILALAAVTGLAPGAELKIGFASEPTSLDPHFHSLVPNRMAQRHVFDTLVFQDEKQGLHPGLAVSWRATADTVWLFDLRRGVNWHDGTEFTADDVVFTVNRAPHVPNSPGGYSTWLNQISEVSAVDRYTVQMKTKEAFPVLPAFLSMIFVIQKKTGEGATTQNYNSGKAVVGTGPYKFVEWVRGDHLTYVRNDDYWGKKEPWERVIIKPISSGPTRVAALLAGDVDLIDQVPPTDIPLLKRNNKITLFPLPSLQIILLNLAQQADKWPYITAVDGSPLPENPLMKWEVRKAISLAINREAIAARTMEGSAVPVGQMVPEGFYGYNPGLKPDSYDPQRAREMLRQAGYPNGFSITIHGPNDRYINDEKIVQAIAQMLTRIGIRTKVETMPVSVFFSKANKREFSLFLTGNGGVTGESSSVLRTLLHSYDEAAGHGTMNRGRYHNKKFDSLLELAMKTIDDTKREQLLKTAMEVGINDLGLIPIHAEVYTWATRKGLRYIPRSDTYTLAMGVRSE